MHAHFPGLSESFSTYRAYLLASHTACQVSPTLENIGIFLWNRERGKSSLFHSLRNKCLLFKVGCIFLNFLSLFFFCLISSFYGLYVLIKVWAHWLLMLELGYTMIHQVRKPWGSLDQCMIFFKASMPLFLELWRKIYFNTWKPQTLSSLSVHRTLHLKLHVDILIGKWKILKKWLIKDQMILKNLKVKSGWARFCLRNDTCFIIFAMKWKRREKSGD